jgi:predicted anti-sigma-YlaC factor YlaD
MKCDELLRMLNDYVDGDIDPSVCARLEEHLEGCDPCRVVIDSIRKTIILYKEEGVTEIPIPFRERLHDTLRERWEQKRGDTEGER